MSCSPFELGCRALESPSWHRILHVFDISLQISSHISPQNLTKHHKAPDPHEMQEILEPSPGVNILESFKVIRFHDRFESYILPTQPKKNTKNNIFFCSWWSLPSTLSSGQMTWAWVNNRKRSFATPHFQNWFLDWWATSWPWLCMLYIYRGLWLYSVYLGIIIISHS